MERFGFGVFGVAHHHSLSFASIVKRHPRASLVGVYDPNEDAAKSFGLRLGVPFYTNMADLLGDEQLKVGIVTCENPLKKDVAIGIAETGRHVLCDKPLGEDTKQSRDIIIACKKNNVKLQVGYLTRYTPDVLETMKIIRAGKIGRIKFIEGENRVDAGSVKRLSPWLATSKATGGRGALVEHAVHLADLVQWYVGSEASSVFAFRSANLDPSFEVEDNFSLFVKYSNGAFATMDGSYCTPSSGRVDDLILNIVGSKGSIRLLIQKKAILLNMGEDPAMSRELIETTLGGRYEGIPAWNMIDDLINSILFDREPLTCGEDARRVNALVEAGYQSLASRMPVKISQ